MDLTLLLLGSPMWAPLLGLISVSSRAMQGPRVFFRQERVGLHGQPFQVLKFRTMILDADVYLDEVGMPTRPRITPLGRFLRRTGLDELPQLINVVRGEMSLVGPRPVLPEWTAKIPNGIGHARFTVLPGITGRAQVAGRNSVPWSQRLELDRRFADEAGVGAYLRVLIATPWAVVRPTVSADRNISTVDDLLYQTTAESPANG